MEEEKREDPADLFRAGGRLLFRWVMMSVLIGVTVGIVGASFHLVLEWVTEYRMTHGWLLYCLPLAGLVIIFLYDKTKMLQDGGTNSILLAARSGENVPLLQLPLIYISTALTHLFGGSAGREGAALQIGGSIGSFWSDRAKFSEGEKSIFTMCGMSAGFAALFGTPITSVVFAMEVTTVGVMHYTAIVPCIIGALIAAGISDALGIAPTAFTLAPISAGIDPLLCLQVAVLAVGCAVVGMLFCMALHMSGKVYQHYVKNPYLRVVVGAVLVIIITLLLGTRDYNGAGMDVIIRAVSGEAAGFAFLWKIILTAVTLGAGFKGGEIVPSLFIGATFGCVAGKLIGLDPAFAACLGMMGVFCSVTNCPLATTILSIELFGGVGLIYFALICAISYTFSGYYSLYSAQRILLSKLNPESERLQEMVKDLHKTA